MGDKGEGGHTIQQRETRRDTRGDKASGRWTHHATKGNKNKDKLGGKLGDKTSGRRAHHPTQAHMWGDHGRQREARPGEGGYTRQNLGKARKPSNTGTHAGRQWETTPVSGRGTHHPTQTHMWGDNGRQGEKRLREGRHTIQQRETRRETMGDKASETRTHHPTKGNKKGHKGRQDLGKGPVSAFSYSSPSSARLLLTHTTYSHRTSSHTHNFLTHTHSLLTHKHKIYSHTTSSHTQLVHTQFHDTQLPHTHTPYSHTHTLLTHTTCHTQLTLTHNLSTHNLLAHNLLAHNLLTHNLSTHNLLTHNLLSQLVHTRLTHTHTTCSHTTFSHTTWHLATSPFTLRGRRGTWRNRHWAGSGGALGSGRRRGCLGGRRCTW